MAMPAAPASAVSTASSSAVNSPCRFSVMYRLPNTSPRTSTGTPRKLFIGGGGGGGEAEGGGGRREADRGGVLPQVGDPQRVRLADQLPQHALALRQRPHHGGEVIVDADVDEGGETATLPQHAQGPVPGIHQVGRGLHDAPQRARQVQPGGDAQEGVEQVLHPGLAPCHRGQPVLPLVDQFGQSHGGQRRLFASAAPEMPLWAGQGRSASPRNSGISSSAEEGGRRRDRACSVTVRRWGRRPTARRSPPESQAWSASPG